MNRTVVFGIAMLVAIVGLTLTGGQKEAEAGWGCRGGKHCRGAARCSGETVTDDACCGHRARRHRCDGDCGCRGRRACRGDHGCRGRRRRCGGEPVDCCGHGSAAPTESGAPGTGDPVPAAPAPKEASHATPLRVVSFR
ncbi:MAG: hypothetical protein GTO76_14200 [Planctomycetales bacterium]|nr:hypothetical protein [Planctomycetales bacterium]NIN78874.1 hypothetical protein [Planctomycetales bacterium]NIO36041.1 hypothetical protein [Planctomycetales bacterium]NIO47783.1 hypothetical protein [Planctomycetales bacterium]NIP05927.1 hypothetical protein [Planctomycetales bacterium]